MRKDLIEAGASPAKKSPERRSVGIAGPVYTEFSRNCAALGLVLQRVATDELSRWNDRNARRARLAERERARLAGSAAQS